jgi:hypothetical protein
MIIFFGLNAIIDHSRLKHLLYLDGIHSYRKGESFFSLEVIDGKV